MIEYKDSVGPIQKIRYVDGFEGRTLFDFVNDRVVYWNKIGAQQKINTGMLGARCNS